MFGNNLGYSRDSKAVKPNKSVVEQNLQMECPLISRLDNLSENPKK